MEWIVLVLLLVWVAVQGSRRRKLEQRLDQQWGEQQQRISRLEDAVGALARRLDAVRAAQADPPRDSQHQAAAASTRVEVPAPVAEAPAPPPPRIATRPAPVPSTDGPPADFAPAFASASPPHVPFSARLRSALDIEEVLGTNWLNKLGVVILVLGVAMFLAYELGQVGPWGKVLVGLAVSGALLGGGLFTEKRERYRMLARAGIGGGWAMLYFTVYAMHHVAAARVISSEPLDLLLLGLLSAAMVAHTLRYNSQVVTGLAFLLGAATIVISHSNVYSLTAEALLAAGLVVIVLRRHWWELEVFGIVAAYGNHFLWLRPVIEAMGGQHRGFPEFPFSVALLLFYWALFRTSYLLRQPGDERQERVSTLAGLLNPVLLLAVMKYQSARPDLAFDALLALGLVEFGLGQWFRRRTRRAPFVLLSAIGGVLVLVAIPFRFAGAPLAMLWLALAGILMCAGVFLAEPVFRRLGLAACLATLVKIVALDLPGVITLRDGTPHLLHNLPLALVCAVGAALFYFTVYGFERLRPGVFPLRWEQLAAQALSISAAGLTLLAIWLALPCLWAGTGWALAGLLLALAARRLQADELELQSVALALAALARMLLVNLPLPGLHLEAPMRTGTVALTAALFYACARFHETGQNRWARPFAWAGSLLVTMLLWYELPPAAVAPAWTALGLLLFESGRVLRRRWPALAPVLLLQGCLAAALAFGRLFFVNFNLTAHPWWSSPLLLTSLPVALGLLYLYWQTETPVPADSLPVWMPATLAALGMAALAGMLRFLLPEEHVVIGWAGLALASLATARWLRRPLFLHCGLVLAAAVVVRGMDHNLIQGSYFHGAFWSQWRGDDLIATTVLLLGLMVAWPLRGLASPPENQENGRKRWWTAIMRHPEQVLFFLPFGLLTAVIGVAAPRGLMTMGWGLEAMGTFLLALLVKERNFRLAGLGLLLVCVGKIALIDVWGLNPRDRFLTLIVLGALLLAVSFLYTRYRERVRQYL